LSSTTASSAPPHGGRAVLWGAATIGLPYAVGLGAYVYGALRILAGVASSGTPDERVMALLWGSALVAIGLAVVLAARGGVDRIALGLSSGRRHGWRRELTWFALAYLALWLSFRVASFVPVLVQAAPSQDDPTALVTVLYALHAGVAEEILILAVPVAVLTRLRAPAWAQIATIVILRSLIHLYYGVSMALVLALVWSVLFWLLYTRFRVILPFVAAHVLYDLVVGNSTLGPAGKILVAVALITLAGGLLVCVRSAWSWSLGRRKRASAATSDRTPPDADPPRKA
jgi:hypothetical protein